MITLTSEVYVPNTRGIDIFDFMVKPNDRAYQRWWPGIHLRLHNIKESPAIVGNVLMMDEYVGSRRLTMRAVVTEAVPGKKLTWQLVKFVPLPAWLTLEFKNDVGGVMLTHTLTTGFGGTSNLFDDLLRLYLTPEFAQALDEHAKTEFPMLGEMLLDARLCPKPTFAIGDI